MNEPTNIVISDECIKQMIHTSVLLAVMLFLGSIGGIARGAFDKLSNYDLNKEFSKSNLNSKPNKIEWSFWFQHIFVGMAGASCAVFATLLLSKYKLEINDIQSLILFSTLSVLGGVMAKRCLPALGNRISREIEQKVKAENKVIKDKVDSFVEKAEEEVIGSKNYSGLLADADVVLKKSSQERDIPEIELAIANMEHSKKQFETDRVFCIRLGRLYRALFEKNGDYICLDKAIITLRNYIDAMEHNNMISDLDKKNMASAYFNIACYHSLKIQTSESQKDRLTNEAIVALKQAIEFDPKLFEEISDQDFDNIRTNDLFPKKTIDNECKK